MKYELKELVVKEKRLRLTPGGMTAIPTSIEKRSSSNGYELLQRMMIPWLVISPTDNTVSLVTRETVTFFINGVPADDEEIKALQPADVTRVEVLRHPIDPKYQGKDAVVNFYVWNRLYGGYVKADISQKILQNIGDYSVYSKYATTKWNYYALVNVGYSRLSGDYSNSESWYKFGDIEITKMDSVYNKRSFGKNYGIALQAIKNYANDGYLKIKGGITVADKFDNGLDGVVIFDGKRNIYTIEHSNIKYSPYIVANYFRRLSHKWQLGINAGMYSSRSSSKSDYNSHNAYDIRSDYDETVLKPTIDVILSKEYSSHSIAWGIKWEMNHYNTQYKGADPYSNIITDNLLRPNISWRYRFAKTWRTQLNFGIPFNFANYYGGRKISILPSVVFNIMGVIRGQHQLSVSNKFGSGGLPVTEYNDYYRKDTQYEGVVGNNTLKNHIIETGNIMYMWNLSPVVTIGCSGFWYAYFRDIVRSYSYHDGVIYSMLRNAGTYFGTEVGVNATFNLMDSKLKIRPSIDYANHRHYGDYTTRISSPSWTISIDYTPIERFAVDISLTSPYKTYYKGYGGRIEKQNYSLSINAGYYWDVWNLRVTSDVLSKFGHTRDFFSTEEFKIDTNDFDRSQGRYIQIAVAYTLKYGRKTSMERVRMENLDATSVR